MSNTLSNLEDYLFRDILTQRASYTLSLDPQAYRPPTKPSDVGGKRPFPVLMESREPDPEMFAKIAASELADLRLYVDRPEIFQPDDIVLVCRGDSDEVLFHANVLDVRGEIVFLKNTEMTNFFQIRIGDRLVRQSQQPSTVMVFPELAPDPVDAKVAEKIRRYKASAPLEVPDERVSRTPGQPPRAMAAYYIPLKGEAGEVLLTGELPFEPAESRHGWMLIRVVEEDCCFNGRWKHWEQTNQAGKFVAAIPQLQFEQPHPKTMEMLLRCLELINPTWNSSPDQQYDTLTWFLDWLLWSLGHPYMAFFPGDRPKVDPRAHDWLVQVFDPSLLVLFPADYFGALIDQVLDRKSFQPSHNLLKELFPGRRNDYRDHLLVDPDCQSGRVMLAASNFTYEYQGVSADPMAARAAIANMYFFCPWYLFPFPWLVKGQQEKSSVDMASRTLQLLRRKRLPQSYFSNLELDLNHRALLPIYKVRDRVAQPLNSLPLDGDPVEFFRALKDDNRLQLPESSQPETLQLPGQLELPNLQFAGNEALQLPGEVMPTQKLAPAEEILQLPEFSNTENQTDLFLSPEPDQKLLLPEAETPQD